MNPLPYFSLDARKRADGRYQIYIRQNLKSAIVIPTDFFLQSETDFKKGFPKDPILRNHCNDLLKKLEAADKKIGGDASLRDCWTAITVADEKSFFLHDWLLATHRYRVNLFDKNWKVTNLTVSRLIDFHSFMKKAGLKDITIGNYLAEIKRAAKRASKYYKVPEEVFTYRPKLKKSLPKEPLNWIELMKLYRLPRHPSLDMFLLECFTGIRYSDLSEKLKVEETAIIFVQEKTGTIAAPALNPIAKEILLRNGTRDIDGQIVFTPHRRAIQSINRNLKAIAKRYGIKKNLSTHIGRHSYSKLLRDLGIPEDYRAMQLGHAATTNTQLYGRSSDYEFANRIVLAAFNRAMTSTATTYTKWLMDVNPVFKDLQLKITG